MLGRMISLLRWHRSAAAVGQVAWRPLSETAGKRTEVLTPPTSSPIEPHEAQSQSVPKKKPEFYSTTPLIMDAHGTAPLK